MAGWDGSILSMLPAASSPAMPPQHFLPTTYYAASCVIVIHAMPPACIFCNTFSCTPHHFSSTTYLSSFSMPASHAGSPAACDFLPTISLLSSRRQLKAWHERKKTAGKQTCLLSPAYSVPCSCLL